VARQPRASYLSQLHVVALAVHSDDDVADAAPAVEAAVSRGERGVAGCGAQGHEAEGCSEKPTTRYSIT